jgi:hypothetical protein
MSVGFSSGCLKDCRMSLEDQMELYLRLGADAYELSLPKPEEVTRLVSKLPEKKRLIQLSHQFSYFSLHAPWRNPPYADDEGTYNLIDDINELCRLLPIKGIVLHPDIIKDYSPFEKSSLPWLIENMDQRKISYTTPAEFAKLAGEHDFGFVLDVLHSYEHDHTMQQAYDFLKVMGSRLGELHVSGTDESHMHRPVNTSPNRRSILEFLTARPGVPIILEGFIPEPIEMMIENEIDLMRIYEK